ncbi:unknown [Ruminococcus sp. CAG:382]|nr:unknown [Ruminococcus sp. CAG:382]
MPLPRRERVRCLINTVRLTRKRRFIADKSNLIYDTAIGRHKIALSHRNDVTGNKQCARNALSRPAAKHLRLWRREPLQRLQRFFRLALLDHADDTVHTHDAENYEGIHSAFSLKP